MLLQCRVPVVVMDQVDQAGVVVLTLRDRINIQFRHQDLDKIVQTHTATEIISAGLVINELPRYDNYNYPLIPVVTLSFSF